jgi:hypothetical protein
VKTTIIALSAAALIAAAPAVLAQGVPSKTPGLQAYVRVDGNHGPDDKTSQLFADLDLL